MREYIEVQIIKKASEFLALVEKKTLKIKKYSNFLDAMKEDAVEITTLVSLGYECYNERERIECYKKALKLCENILFYSRLFYEYNRMTKSGYELVKYQGELLTRLLNGLIKIERKSNIKEQYLFNLKFAK